MPTFGSCLQHNTHSLLLAAPPCRCGKSYLYAFLPNSLKIKVLTPFSVAGVNYKLNLSPVKLQASPKSLFLTFPGPSGGFYGPSMGFCESSVDLYGSSVESNNPSAPGYGSSGDFYKPLAGFRKPSAAIHGSSATVRESSAAFCGPFATRRKSFLPQSSRVRYIAPFLFSFFFFASSAILCFIYSFRLSSEKVGDFIKVLITRPWSLTLYGLRHVLA